MLPKSRHIIAETKIIKGRGDSNIIASEENERSHPPNYSNSQEANYEGTSWTNSLIS